MLTCSEMQIVGTWDHSDLTCRICKLLQIENSCSLLPGPVCWGGMGQGCLSWHRWEWWKSLHQGFQDVVGCIPWSLLRTITLPFNQVLEPTATLPYHNYLLDTIDRLSISDLVVADLAGGTRPTTDCVGPSPKSANNIGLRQVPTEQLPSYLKLGVAASANRQWKTPHLHIWHDR